MKRMVIFDGTCTPDNWVPSYADWIAGGFTGCALSTGGGASADATVARIGEVTGMIEADARLVLALSADDIRSAHANGQLAVMLHFQGTNPLEDDPALVEVFWRLGVRMIQLAYNQRGLVCDGCEVPSDAGLSDLGRRMVAEMNRLGVVIDFSHTGWRSCADTLDVASGPCVASHSNAYAVRAHPRNLPDDIIRGIAKSGGLLGMNGFPAFVSEGAKPTLDQLIDHMVHIDSLVGYGHVGLGLDYCTISAADYQWMLDTGAWSADNYPPPPWHWPAGIENPATIDALAERMSQRSYSEHEIDGISGRTGFVCSPGRRVREGPIDRW